VDKDKPVFIVKMNEVLERIDVSQGNSQGNMAELLEGSQTFICLYDLEVQERIATGGKLNVVLGDNYPPTQVDAAARRTPLEGLAGITT
jgi:hypothetical protein